MAQIKKLKISILISQLFHVVKFNVTLEYTLIFIWGLLWHDGGINFFIAENLTPKSFIVGSM